MRRQRFIAFLVSAVAGFAPATMAAEFIPGARNEQPAGWSSKCRDKDCLLRHEMSAVYKGAAKKISFLLQFDRATSKPYSLLVSLPPDAEPSTSVELGFFDPPDAPTHRDLVGIEVPITRCDRTSCIAQALSDQSQANRDIQKQIIDNLLNFPAVIVTYHLQGDRAVTIEPTAGFKTDYQTFLADLKKPR